MPQQVNSSLRIAAEPLQMMSLSLRAPPRLNQSSPPPPLMA
eukprot:CAMPEP_0170570720 /NCGR_PEP_ID=MMETSP0224-20130122/1267_1 /TAXON_ID=285029 /ORGANISM="Togula jolla, Strain CCCM 725" /LENGTH=40 /DNA_ID= /DNA_START= /DNA_END= /DNA_ORIENTATION=